MDENDKGTAPDRPLPGHETQSGEMSCPACGRFVGAAVKCPYCGAKVEKRMSLVALRWAAVLLATVGLVLLWLMAKTREPAAIRIGDIESTMNFGVVRLSGTVRGEPRPFKNGNGMSFYVADGTGSLIVFVDQTQRKILLADGLLPRKGDGIEFVAQLQASSSGNSARIRSLDPDSFKLVRDGAPVVAAAPAGDEPAAAQADDDATDDDVPPARRGASPARRAAPAPARDLGPAVPFSAVGESFVGKSVVLEGAVTAVKEPDAGTRQPYVLTLRNGTDGVDVRVWSNQFARIPDRETLPGSAVRLKADVKRFRGEIELMLADPEDLVRAEPAAKKGRRPVVSVAEAAAAQLGGYVTVEGALSDPADLAGKGTSYKLADGTGSIQVVFWNGTVPPELQKKAAAAPRVRVNGKVKEYQGARQVVPGATGVEIPE